MALMKSKYLVVLLLLLSIIVFTGCAKKTTKIRGMGDDITAGNIGEDGTLEGNTDDMIANEHVRQNIENALEELEQLYNSSQDNDYGRTDKQVLLEERTAALEKVNKLVKDTGTLLPVFFDYDKYSIREDARTTLRNNAEWLSDHPSLKILIAGHADPRGSNEYNLALGDRRAKSVVRYLSDFGVNAELRTVTFGEEKPNCYDANETCWAQNRRAEFAVVAAD
jgi:peptidoglycan-associated lipoprotein